MCSCAVADISGSSLAAPDPEAGQAPPCLLVTSEVLHATSALLVGSPNVNSGLLAPLERLLAGLLDRSAGPAGTSGVCAGRSTRHNNMPAAPGCAICDGVCVW